MATPPPTARAHRRRPMAGRDPNESHRSATPLELFYDLTFVVSFGVAADELAHFVAEKHIGAGIAGFAFAIFAVSWAWINYTWFSSSYDTDDWVFRLATMVQMVGVIVLALGLPEAFESIDHGDTLDNGVMVAGYVIMRVPMLFLWWQASRHDPEHAPAARTYQWTIALAQVGWVGLVFLSLPVVTTFAVASVLFVIEIAGPRIAERKGGGTPWHAGHICERYGLLVIITLGEGIIGTVAALNSLVHAEAGWTTDAVLIAVAGVGLTFGAWWMYFCVEWHDVIGRRRSRIFGWGYGHIVIFGSLSAMGAGLHVAAYFLEHESKIGATGAVLSVVIPFAVYVLALYITFAIVMQDLDAFHLVLVALTAGVLILTVVLAASGVSMAVCLLVLTLAPVVTVVGYELVGHRHIDEMIERIKAEDASESA